MAGNLTKPEAERRLATGGVAKRGLSIEEAGAYVGLSASAFAKEVAAGRFPGPMPLRSSRRKIWDRAALDRALDGEPDKSPRGRDPIMDAINAAQSAEVR